MCVRTVTTVWNAAGLAFLYFSFVFFSFDLKKLVPSRKVVCYYISKESS